MSCLFFTPMCNTSIMSDAVISGVIRYVSSSQDLLTTMPFALFRPDEGMQFVSVAGIGQPQIVRRMEVLILTSLRLLLHHRKLHGLQWRYSRFTLVQEGLLPGSEVLLFFTCHQNND